MKRETKLLPPLKRLRHRLEVDAVRALGWLVRCLPRRTVQKLGRGLGWLAYYLGSDARRVCRANLDIAFGDRKSQAEKQRIARRSVQSAVATLLCLLWAPRLTRETIDRYIEVDADNLAWLNNVRARGKGIIFAPLHYGDWELLGLATSYYGFPLTIVQEAMQNEALGEILGRLRACSGNQIISHRSASLRLLKALRRGENVAMLIDLNAAWRAGGVWVDFSGSGLQQLQCHGLALHTGASIVFVAALPQPNGRSKAVYSPEIPCVPTGDDDADLRAISQACLDCCEKLIRPQPEHWLWAYKRWKVRPSGDRGRYPFYSKLLYGARGFVVLDDGRVTAATQFLPALKAAALTTFDKFMSLPAQNVVRSVPGRSTVRVELQNFVGYLKRYEPGYLSPTQKILRWHHWPGSDDEALREWRKILRLREHGFLTAAPVAVGHQGHASFLLQEEIVGRVPADEYLQSLTTARRRRLLPQLGALARRLRDAGFIHKDLYLKHIFVVERGEEWELSLIDLQRVLGPRRHRERWYLKDAAALAHSARLRAHCSRTDLLRLYQGYARGAVDRAFVRKVWSRMERLRRHPPKYQRVWNA